MFDPFAFSGTPLIGGINAGATFPAIALFAVFPPISAFVVTEIVSFAAAAVGLYAFLRFNVLHPLPSAH